MKKSLLFLLLFCFQTSLLIAQVPSGMNYSAIVRNTNGEIRANQNVKFTFKIIDSNQTTIYTETHDLTTNGDGMISAIIGKGSSNDDFQLVDWGSNNQLNIDIDGKDMGTIKLWTVPYAFYADNGVTQVQANAIIANTLKKGVSQGLEDSVAANTLKKGVSQGLEDSVAANTAKVGITQDQIDAIISNSSKKGVSQGLEDSVTANTAKVGITQDQIDAIISNSSKKGVSQGLEDSVAANTEKKGVGIQVLTQREREALTNVADGTVVFQKDGNSKQWTDSNRKGLYLYFEKKWYPITDTQSEVKTSTASSFSVSTVSGKQYSGDVDGKPEVARFNEPTGIESVGTSFYIADYKNKKIREYVPDGMPGGPSVSTLATFDYYSFPNGIVYDERVNNTFYVTAINANGIGNNRNDYSSCLYMIYNNQISRIGGFCSSNNKNQSSPNSNTFPKSILNQDIFYGLTGIAYDMRNDFLYLMDSRIKVSSANDGRRGLIYQLKKYNNEWKIEKVVTNKLNNKNDHTHLDYSTNALALDSLGENLYYFAYEDIIQNTNATQRKNLYKLNIATGEILLMAKGYDILQKYGANTLHVYGILVKNNNIYFTTRDVNGHVFRVNQNLDIDLIAGGESGVDSKDGAGNMITIHNPRGIEFNPLDGSLMVVQDHKIRKIKK